MKKSEVQQAAEGLMLSKLDAPHSPVRRRGRIVTPNNVPDNWNGPSFKTNDVERATIGLCARRAISMMSRSHRPKGDDGDLWRDWCMDLAATHANGCKLDLDKLLAFDNFNFAHDVFGIREHLDRKTGKLKDFFLPRCAQPRQRSQRKSLTRSGKIEA